MQTTSKLIAGKRYFDFALGDPYNLAMARGQSDYKANSLLFGTRLKTVYASIWDKNPSKDSQEIYAEFSNALVRDSIYNIDEQGFKKAFDELERSWPDIPESKLARELLERMAFLTVLKSRSYPDDFLPEPLDAELLAKERSAQLLQSDPDFSALQKFLIDDCFSHLEVESIDDLSEMSQKLVLRYKNALIQAYTQNNQKQEALMVLKELKSGVVKDYLMQYLLASSLREITYARAQTWESIKAHDVQSLAVSLGWESAQTKTIVNSRSSWSSKDLIHHIIKDDDKTVCGRPLRKPGQTHSHWRASSRGIWNIERNRPCARCFKHAADYPETQEQFYWQVFPEQADDRAKAYEFIEAYLKTLPERPSGVPRKSDAITGYDGALDDLKKDVLAFVDNLHNNLFADRLASTPLSQTVQAICPREYHSYRDRIVESLEGQELSKTEWVELLEKAKTLSYPYGQREKLFSVVKEHLNIDITKLPLPAPKLAPVVAAPAVSEPLAAKPYSSDDFSYDDIPF